MILICDDFKTQRMFLESVCKELQFPYFVASNGEEALKLLNAFDFSLLITDLEMPVMDGLQLLAEIKKNPKFNNLRVLMISSANTLREKALNAGVHTYISKPYEKEDVSRAIIEQMNVNKPLRTYRVLLIDDVMMQTAIWEKSLEMENFEFVKTHSAAEALATLRAEHIDAIITDYLMPAVDGSRFIRKIKSIPEFQNIPVFVITSDLSVTKEMMGDVRQIFFKPFKAAEVKSALKSAVGWGL